MIQHVCIGCKLLADKLVRFVRWYHLCIFLHFFPSIILFILDEIIFENHLYIFKSPAFGVGSLREFMQWNDPADPPITVRVMEHWPSLSSEVTKSPSLDNLKDVPGHGSGNSVLDVPA